MELLILDGDMATLDVDAMVRDRCHDRVMAINGVDHVQLAMPAGGEPEARHFYEDLLGLLEVPKPANLAARGGCWFETPGARIHLGVEAEFRPARKAHPALLVTDLGSLAAQLDGAGVEVIDGDPLEGYERVFVHDPFGNRIELMEPVED